MRDVWRFVARLEQFHAHRGFIVSNPCRTASARHTRNTFTPRFAVERERSFASRSRNRAMSIACSVERSRLVFAPRNSVKAFHDASVTVCVDPSASIAFASSHVSHHAAIDALGSDSMLVAVNTSLTPRAITSRAASTLSLPLRASSEALCQARQISSACVCRWFLWSERRACSLGFQGSRSRRRRTSRVCAVDDVRLA